jgi:hypothetical protein
MGCTSTLNQADPVDNLLSPAPPQDLLTIWVAELSLATETLLHKGSLPSLAEENFQEWWRTAELREYESWERRG